VLLQRRFFTQLTELFKTPNYTARNAPEYATYLEQIDELVKTLGRITMRARDASSTRRRLVTSVGALTSSSPPTPCGSLRRGRFAAARLLRTLGGMQPMAPTVNRGYLAGG
jgi:hypothetical protein